VPAASFEVPIQPLPPERFRPLLGDAYREIEAAIERARVLLGGRTVWHINSTARGGGVVELLRSLLAYAAGAGVSVRWLVVTGPPEFFAVTKRLHNHLHGVPGDGGLLDEEARWTYERTLTRSAEEIQALMRTGDVVVCHDPQTAGLVPMLAGLADGVLWRCHVGIDEPNDLARAAWAFLEPWVERADGYIFSRRQFVWEGLDDGRVFISEPVIDAFSPKNQELDPATCTSILCRADLLAGEASAVPSFVREDGSPARVTSSAAVERDRLLRADDRIVCQVSRWDRLKDPLGVMEALADRLPRAGAHLVLAGPAAGAVSDDPESAAALAEVSGARRRLEPGLRERVHLASLPMADLEENAAIVNALQRHSEIVVQKSLAEGFGLTVAEAMWKRRPVVASRVGGIQDQIVDSESGILVGARDLDAFADAVIGLIEKPDRGHAIGEAAQRRVREHFLATAGLLRYLGFIEFALRTAGAHRTPAS
jgi:trehalose synthase